MEDQPKPAPRRTATKKAPTTAAGPKPRRTTAAAGARTPSTVDAIGPTPVAGTKPKAPRVRAPRATPVPPPAIPRSRTPLTGQDRAAVDAVARLGPDARDWVARTRARYPDAKPAAVARLAATQPRDPAWLVLAIAAAFEVDATDPARARDLQQLRPPGFYSGRSALAERARARYSQETWPRSSV